MPTTGCHQGTPGGMDCRAIISIGVDTGTNEIAVASGPLGSLTTDPRANIGRQIISTTGMSSVCVSLMSVQAAPMAMKSEPYISTANIWYTTNQRSTVGGRYSVTSNCTAAQ